MTTRKFVKFVQFQKELANTSTISDGNPFAVDDAEVRDNIEAWGQLNALDVKNDSGTAIDYFLDGDPARRYRVEAGQGSVIDPVERLHFRRVTFQRVNAVDIASGELRVMFQRLQPRSVQF